MKDSVVCALDLPSDILHSVLSQWIATPDLAKLDSAVCNKKARVSYMSAIQKPYFSTSGYPRSQSNKQANDDERIRQSRYVQWLLIRKIQIRSLDLTILSSAKNLSMQVGNFLTQVEVLKVSFEDQLSSRLAVTVIRSCASKLKSLSLCSSVCDYEMVKFYGFHFPNLRKLDISKCKASGRTVGDVLHHTPQLQELVMDGTNNFDGNIIQAIKDHCPRLSVLSLKHCSNVSLEALTLLPQSKLSMLDLSFCKGISESIWTKFIVNLVKLTRNLNLYKAEGLSEDSLQTLASIDLSPRADKVIDLRYASSNLSLDLRIKLLSLTGLYVLGI